MRPSAQLCSAADDDTLMAHVAARDADAFRELAGRHGALGYRIGYRMTGDVTEAEDIAQEAMVRAWRTALGGAACCGGLRRKGGSATPAAVPRRT